MDGNLISMLTAFSEPGAKSEELSEHVLDYLIKPVHPNALVSFVSDFMAADSA